VKTSSSIRRATTHSFRRIQSKSQDCCRTLYYRILSQQYNKKMYVQLMQHEPITELEVAGEEVDPTFQKKLSELTVRLAFGSVGGKYGGGYGFLSFAKRLNSFR
jgi:hypothetical protein